MINHDDKMLIFFISKQYMLKYIIHFAPEVCS